MKKWEKVVGVIYLLGFVICVIVSVYMWWRSDAEVYTYKKRAQVAAEAEDMLDYLGQLKNGMERWKMTNGYYALIFKTPWNNAELDYQVVEKAIDRVVRIVKMDKEGVAYQTGMDDVRGIIRELEMDVFYFWSLHTPLLWGFVTQWIAKCSWLVVFIYICIRIIYIKIKEDREYMSAFKK